MVSIDLFRTLNPQIPRNIRGRYVSGSYSPDSNWPQQWPYGKATPPVGQLCTWAYLFKLLKNIKAHSWVITVTGFPVNHHKWWYDICIYFRWLRQLSKLSTCSHTVLSPPVCQGGVCWRGRFSGRALSCCGPQSSAGCWFSRETSETSAATWNHSGWWERGHIPI